MHESLCLSPPLYPSSPTRTIFPIHASILFLIFHFVRIWKFDSLSHFPFCTHSINSKEKKKERKRKKLFPLLFPPKVLSSETEGEKKLFFREERKAVRYQNIRHLVLPLVWFSPFFSPPLPSNHHHLISMYIFTHAYTCTICTGIHLLVIVGFLAHYIP